VTVSCAARIDTPTTSQAWVEARQLYGLWALGLLVASMIPGPLAYVLPWNPVNGHLVLGRRAFGVCGFACAVLHASCFLVPLVAARDWPRLYQPGAAWIVGLVCAVPLLAIMAALAATSANRAVRAIGPRRWKRWHRLVYALLPSALVHAVCMGSDFGFNKAPDVPGEADAGCLVGMGLASAAWLTLVILRWRGVRWTPARLVRPTRVVSGRPS
jgi:DMSO/TMAO reductase YedYZ heme-binding membrane subunit